MIKELLAQVNDSENYSRGSRNNTIVSNKKMNSKKKNFQLSALDIYNLNDTKINKRPKSSHYASHKALYTSFSKEKGNNSFSTNNLRNKRKNSSKSFNPIVYKKGNFRNSNKENNSNFMKYLDKNLYTLFEKKMLLLKDINNLRRYKEYLIKLNEQNNEYKKEINLIEKDIAKYRSIIQTSQKNYIDLSFEYSNLKSNFERIKHIINQYQKKKK